MPEPPRVDAFAAIVAVIQSMTGIRAWNGITFEYPNTPKVELGHAEITTVNYFPMFWVHSWFGGGVGLAEGQRQTVTVGAELQALDVFPVMVLGQFKTTDDGTPAEVWMQRGLWDLRHTLAASKTLGGSIRDMRLGESRPDAGFYAPHHMAEFEQVVLVYIDERYQVA